MNEKQLQKKIDDANVALRMHLRKKYPLNTLWWVKTRPHQKKPTVMEVIGYDTGECFSGVRFWRPARPGPYGCQIRAYQCTVMTSQIVKQFVKT